VRRERVRSRRRGGGEEGEEGERGEEECTIFNCIFFC